MITTIFFDCFGTVFDMSSVSKDIMKYYSKILKSEVWEPLIFPKYFETLPAHPDSAEGIQLLRKKYMVVTCANGPLGLLAKMSKHNGISWDAIVPLEMNKVYKPNPEAYLSVCRILGVDPAEVMMTTANKTFGDLEAAEKLGMKPQLIREEGYPKDIISLAKELGC